MDDLRYKTGLKNAIKDKGFNNKPLPAKLKPDRYSPMPRRKDENEQERIPGKLKDRHFDFMNQKKEVEQKQLPGKLKNRFRFTPKQKPTELNKFCNNK